MAITKEQLQNRENYYGGSDMTALMGTSPFKTAWDLFEEKTGIKEIKSFYNLYMEVGNISEPKIQKLYKLLNVDDEEYRKKEKGITRPLIGHIDGIESDEVIAEIKASTKKIGEIKKQYMPQIQFYMHVTGFKKCKLIAYDRTEHKELVNDILKGNGLHYLHELDDENHPALIELNESLKDVKILKKNCKTSVIEYNEEYIAKMLDTLRVFDEMIEQYNENPFALEEIKENFFKYFDKKVEIESVFVDDEIDEIIKLKQEIDDTKKTIKPLEDKVKKYYSEIAKTADGNILDGEKLKITISKVEKTNYDIDGIISWLDEQGLKIPEEYITDASYKRVNYKIKDQEGNF